MIRPYTASDWKPLVALWNLCLPYDPITEDRFWQLILLDANFCAEGFWVAEQEGRIVGALQAIQEGERGFLTCFFVHPEWRRRGIGRSLLEAGEAFLQSRGAQSVSCNGYAPYYLFPGVDSRYAEAQAFLLASGFRVQAEAVAMGMTLDQAQTPSEVVASRQRLFEEGYEIRLFRKEDTLALLEFGESEFPYWKSSIRHDLMLGNLAITVAMHGQECVGVAQWQNTHTDPPHGLAGRFGPFGIKAELRSKGIGAVLFWEVVERVRAEGSKYLWFGWAGGRNVAFYERMGCHVTRNYTLFRK